MVVHTDEELGLTCVSEVLGQVKITYGRIRIQPEAYSSRHIQSTQNTRELRMRLDRFKAVEAIEL